MPLPDLNADELKLAQRHALQTFYWEKKDLAAYLVIARAVLERLLEHYHADPDNHAAFGEVAVLTTFNIASMCWSGWHETGITIGQAERQLGLSAAALNVTLAERLNLKAERRQNGLWMQGAQLLANGQVAPARQSFMTQLVVIEGAALEFAALPKSWIVACDVLAGDATEGHLNEALAALGTTDEGKAQVGYLKTALQIFQTEGIH